MSKIQPFLSGIATIIIGVAGVLISYEVFLIQKQNDAINIASYNYDFWKYVGAYNKENVNLQAATGDRYAKYFEAYVKYSAYYASHYKETNSYRYKSKMMYYNYLLLGAYAKYKDDMINNATQFDIFYRENNNLAGKLKISSWKKINGYEIANNEYVDNELRNLNNSYAYLTQTVTRHEEINDKLMSSYFYNFGTILKTEPPSEMFIQEFLKVKKTKI